MVAFGVELGLYAAEAIQCLNDVLLFGCQVQCGQSWLFWAGRYGHQPECFAAYRIQHTGGLSQNFIPDKRNATVEHQETVSPLVLRRCARTGQVGVLPRQVNQCILVQFEPDT